jgi:hypothetical protein
LTDNTLEFSATAGFDHVRYAVTLHFFAPIAIDKSRHNVEPRSISFFLAKQEEAWWPSLVKEGKQRYITVDWEKYKDEDDRDIPGVDTDFDIPLPEEPLPEDLS